MSLLDKLRERFANANLSKFSNFDAVLQYNIKDNGPIAAVFAVDLSTGKFMEGTVATPDATFTLEFNDYLALHNNTVTMITLVEQGKLTVEGNMNLVKALDAKRTQA